MKEQIITADQLDISKLWELYPRKKFNCYGFEEIWFPDGPNKGWHRENIYKSSEPLADEHIKERLSAAHKAGAVSVNFIMKSKSGLATMNANPDYKISEFIIKEFRQ